MRGRFCVVGLDDRLISRSVSSFVLSFVPCGCSLLCESTLTWRISRASSDDGTAGSTAFTEPIPHPNREKHATT